MVLVNIKAMKLSGGNLRILSALPQKKVLNRKYCEFNKNSPYNIVPSNDKSQLITSTSYFNIKNIL